MKALGSLLLGFAALTAAGQSVPPLNDPATKDYFPGKFVWADLATANPKAATAFYTSLFGWTASTIQHPTSHGVRSYVVLSLNSRPIAGIYERTPQKGDSVDGRWIGFISVPDVHRALATATAAGSRTVSTEREVPQRGIQAIVSDPEGRVVGLVHSISGDPGEYLPELGEWTWVEFFSRDPEAACRFYSNVAGYTFQPDTRNPRPDSYLLVGGGYSRASVLHVSSKPGAHPALLLLVRVASVKDTIARVAGLGGRVLVAPSDTPTEYWRGVIADPTGAHLGLVQLEAPPAKPARP